MADPAKMNWESLRRIITTDSAAGRSDILLDGAPAKKMVIEENGLAEIWSAALTNGALARTDDRLAGIDMKLEPDGEDGVKVRWFTVPVEDETISAQEREAKVALGFAALGAADARIDTSRHVMMHKTRSIDVIIVVRGEVDLLLDDGEARALKSGDVIIQQATNHAWVNRGAETALLVAILMATP